MRWTCTKCGHVITASKIVRPVRCKCGYTDREGEQITGEPKESGTVAYLIGSLKTYSQAMTRWIAEGSPIRDAAEVQRIHDTICLPCEHYVEGVCQKCGCRLSRLSGLTAAPRNKIAMGTEHCPVGKW